MNWKSKFNPKYTQISLYVIATAAAIYALFQLGDHLGAIISRIGIILQWISVILKPLIIGLACAYVLNPLVDLLQRRLENLKFNKKRHKSARGSAVALTVMAILLVFLILMTVLVSLVTREIHMVRFDDITSFINEFYTNIKSAYLSLSRWLKSLNISSKELASYRDMVSKWLTNYGKNISSNFVGSVSAITGFLSTLVFSFIFTIYFLLDGKPLGRYWDKVLQALTNERSYKGIRLFMKDANRVFSGYIRGQLLDALFILVTIGLAYTFIGVRFGIVIAVLTGIGNLIPYVGPIVAYVTTVAACLLDGDIKKMIIALVCVFVIQTIDGNVVNPKLLSSNTDVHPILVIAALLVGNASGGLLGMLFAVPLAALIKIQFERFVVNYQEYKKKA